MSFGNGSGQIQFSEVLPSSQEHGVFNSGGFSSDQVVGNARISGGSKKYRKRKQKGGDALDFSAFTPDAQAGAAAVGNPPIDAALNGIGGEPLATNSVPSTEGGLPPVEGGEINPSFTNPAISIGGKRTRRRKTDKKKKTKKRKQTKKKQSRKRRRGKK
jgi:hypothetical protein